MICVLQLSHSIVVGLVRLMAGVLGEDYVTHMEVPGAHHTFDAFASPRAFKMLDAVEEWLHDFEHHYMAGSVTQQAGSK